jgi:hypothetical protein
MEHKKGYGSKNQRLTSVMGGIYQVKEARLIDYSFPNMLKQMAHCLEIFNPGGGL